MLAPEDADEFARKLAGATARVVQDYASGDVLHEEPFSDQLCGRLKETLQDFSTENIDWQVNTATRKLGRGRLSARTLTKTKEEPEFGADIVMALDIETEGYSVRKGYLAQAKRLEKGQLLRSDEHRRLLNQCERMLSLTPSSMVFLYSKQDVTVVPAAAVLALKHFDLWKIETYEPRILYRDFAICWFGDTKLQATNPASLEGLRSLVDANSAIGFVGRGREPEWDAEEPDWHEWGEN